MSSKFLRFICMGLLGGIFFLPSLAMAEDSVLPSDVFAAIMLKTLNYDRNIDRRAKDKIVIGILCSAGDSGAQDFANKVQEAISKVQSNLRIKDKPVGVQILTLDKNPDKAEIEAQLKKENISVVVVTAQNSDVKRNIFETTRAMGINSICYDAGCVREGAGLGIVLRDNKPKMLINLTAAEQEASDYSSKFLTLCETVQ